MGEGGRAERTDLDIATAEGLIRDRVRLARLSEAYGGLPGFAQARDLLVQASRPREFRDGDRERERAEIAAEFAYPRGRVSKPVARSFAVASSNP